VTLGLGTKITVNFGVAEPADDEIVEEEPSTEESGEASAEVSE